MPARGQSGGRDHLRLVCRLCFLDLLWPWGRGWGGGRHGRGRGRFSSRATTVESLVRRQGGSAGQLAQRRLRAQKRLEHACASLEGGSLLRKDDHLRRANDPIGSDRCTPPALSDLPGGQIAQRWFNCTSLPCAQALQLLALQLRRVVRRAARRSRQGVKLADGCAVTNDAVVVERRLET